MDDPTLEPKSLAQSFNETPDGIALHHVSGVRSLLPSMIFFAAVSATLNWRFANEDQSTGAFIFTCLVFLAGADFVLQWYEEILGRRCVAFIAAQLEAEKKNGKE
jgi:hypothetical protein